MRLYSSGSIFLLRLISMRDVLTISLLWLSIGVVLALLSRNLVKSGLFLWWWLIISLILSFRSSDLFFFYIYFELRLIPILLIILLSGNQPERLSAGSYLLFYTTLISVPYLVLIFFYKYNQYCNKSSRINLKIKRIHSGSLDSISY